MAPLVKRWSNLFVELQDWLSSAEAFIWALAFPYACRTRAQKLRHKSVLRQRIATGNKSFAPKEEMEARMLFHESINLKPSEAGLLSSALRAMWESFRPVWNWNLRKNSVKKLSAFVNITAAIRRDLRSMRETLFRRCSSKNSSCIFMRTAITSFRTRIYSWLLPVRFALLGKLTLACCDSMNTLCLLFSSKSRCNVFTRASSSEFWKRMAASSSICWFSCGREGERCWKCNWAVLGASATRNLRGNRKTEPMNADFEAIHRTAGLTLTSLGEFSRLFCPPQSNSSGKNTRREREGICTHPDQMRLENGVLFSNLTIWWHSLNQHESIHLILQHFSKRCDNPKKIKQNFLNTYRMMNTEASSLKRKFLVLLGTLHEEYARVWVLGTQAFAKSSRVTDTTCSSLLAKHWMQTVREREHVFTWI